LPGQINKILPFSQAFFPAGYPAFCAFQIILTARQRDVVSGIMRRGLATQWFSN
jgi:hypothetical protein